MMSEEEKLPGGKKSLEVLRPACGGKQFCLCNQPLDLVKLSDT